MEGPSLPGFVQKRLLWWCSREPRKLRPPTEYLGNIQTKLCRLALTRIVTLETAAVADRGTPAQWISGQQASPLVQSDVRGHCKGLVRQFRGDARTSKQKSRLQRRCHCNHCTCSSTSRSANFAHDDRIYCQALTRCSLMLLRGVELASPVL